eukprot:tig00020830_g14513.t1
MAGPSNVIDNIDLTGIDDDDDGKGPAGPTAKPRATSASPSAVSGPASQPPGAASGSAAPPQPAARAFAVAAQPPYACAAAAAPPQPAACAPAATSAAVAPAASTAPSRVPRPAPSQAAAPLQPSPRAAAAPPPSKSGPPAAAASRASGEHSRPSSSGAAAAPFPPPASLAQTHAAPAPPDRAPTAASRSHSVQTSLGAVSRSSAPSHPAAPVAPAAGPSRLSAVFFPPPSPAPGPSCASSSAGGAPSPGAASPGAQRGSLRPAEDAFQQPPVPEPAAPEGPPPRAGAPASKARRRAVDLEDGEEEGGAEAAPAPQAAGGGRGSRRVEVEDEATTSPVELHPDSSEEEQEEQEEEEEEEEEEEPAAVPPPPPQQQQRAPPDIIVLDDSDDEAGGPAPAAPRPSAPRREPASDAGKPAKLPRQAGAPPPPGRSPSAAGGAAGGPAAPPARPKRTAATREVNYCETKRHKKPQQRAVSPSSSAGSSSSGPAPGPTRHGPIKSSSARQQGSCALHDPPRPPSMLATKIGRLPSEGEAASQAFRPLASKCVAAALRAGGSGPVSAPATAASFSSSTPPQGQEQPAAWHQALARRFLVDPEILGWSQGDAAGTPFESCGWDAVEAAAARGLGCKVTQVAVKQLKVDPRNPKLPTAGPAVDEEVKRQVAALAHSGSGPQRGKFWFPKRSAQFLRDIGHDSRASLEEALEAFKRRGFVEHAQILIGRIRDTLDPAYDPLQASFGLFARPAERGGVGIRKGEVLGAYWGVLRLDGLERLLEDDEEEVLRKHRRARYGMSIVISNGKPESSKRGAAAAQPKVKAGLYIDSFEKRGLLALVNDYRGCTGQNKREPNAEALEVLYDQCPMVLYIASRDIAPGEQLLVDYGEEYWEENSVQLVGSTLRLLYRAHKKEAAWILKDEMNRAIIAQDPWTRGSAFGSNGLMEMALVALGNHAGWIGGAAPPPAAALGGADLESELVKACRTGAIEDVCAKLEAGADADCGGTGAAVRAAASCGKAGAVRALLERGASRGLPDAEGRTALHHAVAARPHDPARHALRALLRGCSPADLAAADRTGRTALHLAASRADPLAARLLLFNGARADESVLELARQALAALRRAEAALAGAPGPKAKWKGRIPAGDRLARCPPVAGLGELLPYQRAVAEGTRADVLRSLGFCDPEGGVDETQLRAYRERVLKDGRLNAEPEAERRDVWDGGLFLRPCRARAVNTELPGPPFLRPLGLASPPPPSGPSPGPSSLPTALPVSGPSAPASPSRPGPAAAESPAPQRRPARPPAAPEAPAGARWKREDARGVDYRETKRRRRRRAGSSPSPSPSEGPLVLPRGEPASAAPPRQAGRAPQPAGGHAAARAPRHHGAGAQGGESAAAAAASSRGSASSSSSRSSSSPASASRGRPGQGQERPAWWHRALARRHLVDPEVLGWSQGDAPGAPFEPCGWDAVVAAAARGVGAELSQVALRPLKVGPASWRMRAEAGKAEAVEREVQRRLAELDAAEAARGRPGPRPPPSGAARWTPPCARRRAGPSGPGRPAPDGAWGAGQFLRDIGHESRASLEEALKAFKRRGFAEHAQILIGRIRDTLDPAYDPLQASFGLFARRAPPGSRGRVSIRAGEVIGLYAGVLRLGGLERDEEDCDHEEALRRHKQARYAFDVGISAAKAEAKQGKRPNRIRGGRAAGRPAAAGGGASRAKLWFDGYEERGLLALINDPRSRRSQKKREANVEPVEVLHDRWPLIVFLATRDIEEGEQLLLDYGEEYWADDYVPITLPLLYETHRGKAKAWALKNYREPPEALDLPVQI